MSGGVVHRHAARLGQNHHGKRGEGQNMYCGNVEDVLLESPCNHSRNISVGGQDGDRYQPQQEWSFRQTRNQCLAARPHAAECATPIERTEGKKEPS